MKAWVASILGLLPVAALAQTANVKIKIDATLCSRSEQYGPNSMRLYSTLGRPSTLGLSFYLEAGLRAYASQRLERIHGDPDRDLLDEYYIEDEGIWRLGKQYLPFGSGNILRENVNAARGDTNLIVEGIPVSVALCDGGPGLQRGLIGRVGGNIGFSAAIGSHWGIAPTALTYVRRPEDSPGKGSGWKNAWGADIYRKSGIFLLRGEGVLLRSPERPGSPDMNIGDFSATLEPDRYRSVTFGWTRLTPHRADYYRLMGTFWVSKGVVFEPMLRYLDSKLYDVSLSVRVRF